MTKNIKEKLKDKMFKSVATLEDRIKHKLNLVKKEDVLAKAYSKPKEALDDKSRTEHPAPGGNINAGSRSNNVDPKANPQSSPGAKNGNSENQRAMGSQAGQTAVNQAPIDWQRIADRNQLFELQLENYKKDYKKWINDRNSAVSAGQPFHDPEPQKPRKFVFAQDFLERAREKLTKMASSAPKK